MSSHRLFSFPGSLGACFLALILSFVSSRAMAGDDVAAKSAALNQELTKVRADLAAAQTSLTAQTKELWQQQHDLEYQDPEAIKISEDIKALEAQLMQKRQQLAARLTLIPAMKDVEKKRKELFANLQSLKDQEQAILREITALQNASAVSP